MRFFSKMRKFFRRKSSNAQLLSSIKPTPIGELIALSKELQSPQRTKGGYELMPAKAGKDFGIFTTKLNGIKSLDVIRVTDSTGRSLDGVILSGGKHYISVMGKDRKIVTIKLDERVKVEAI